MFIDTHCHLTHDNYENVENIILKLSPNIIIVNGIDKKTSMDAIELAKKYKNVYAAIGIHPEEVDHFSNEDIEYIENNIKLPEVVAIGEIGLDYYWRKDNKEEQKVLFKRQIELALKYKKALIIHSRDAIEDTYTILSEYNTKYNSLKIVLHCYGSSVEMAKKFLNMNVMFGIGGVLTFKNEKKLKEVVNQISLNKLLLETDSPYLSPEPFRGKINIPNNIPIIANKIAEIKNIDVEEVLEITTKNAIEQFDLDV